MKNEYIALLLGLGFLFGFGINLFFDSNLIRPIISEEIKIVDQLRTKGLNLTFDNRLRVWMWDDKSKTSFRLDHQVLDRMSKELK
jgi:hypothetical protein